MRIPGLRGLKVRTLVQRTFHEFLRDDAPTYAAALAFHLFLAVFPFLLFLLALLSFVDLPQLFEWLLARADNVLPPAALEQVEQVIGEIRRRRQVELLSFGIIASVWIASAGMRSAMNALNAAYDIEEGRAVWKRYGLSIVYTLGFTALVIGATLLMVVGPQLTAGAAEGLALGGAVLTAWQWLRYPVALLLAMLAAALVYFFAPNLDQRFRLVTPGSVLAVLLWAAVSLGFRFYVTQFRSYSVTYGSVGAVIVLLLYFFLSASVLLLGGEVNAVIQHHDPRPDDPHPRPPEPNRGITARRHPTARG